MRVIEIREGDVVHFSVKRRTLLIAGERGQIVPLPRTAVGYDGRGRLTFTSGNRTTLIVDCAKQPEVAAAIWATMVGYYFDEALEQGVADGLSVTLQPFNPTWTGRAAAAARR